MRVQTVHNRLRGGRLKRQCQDELSDGLSDGADRMAGTARALAPVDLGKLKASIQAVREGRTTYAVLASGDPPATAFFQEWGTGREAEPGAPEQPRRQTKWTYKHYKYGWITTYGNPSQPFLRPSYETHYRGVIADVARRYASL